MTVEGWEVFKIAADVFLVVAVSTVGALLKALHASNISRLDELKEQIEHLDERLDRTRRDAVEAARALAIDHRSLPSRSEIVDISNRIGRIESILLRGTG